ncbi:MAG: NUDIX domain-containing protein [Polyangiaceae bacterium]|nr:NUDIX domain-containing protein [Polyangiaceae bacterium]
MRIPKAAWTIVYEVARHVLRRPVVGICCAAKTEDGRWLLIRRSDTNQWAMPGGTLEWGETFRTAIERELLEEAGCRVVSLGGISGVYSGPERDPRFHAVTLVVSATVTQPHAPPVNPLEILEVQLFADDELPETLSHSQTDMFQAARQGQLRWE